LGDVLADGHWPYIALLHGLKPLGELKRPGAAKGESKPRWRANATIFTPSHSVRPKVLARWNERFDTIQLVAFANKKDRFTLQITLHDNEPLAMLAGRLPSWSITRIPGLGPIVVPKGRRQVHAKRGAPPTTPRTGRGSLMDERKEERLHESIGFVGLRAQATAVGLLQLCAELVRAGVLDDQAVARIKEAIAKDIALSRPRSVSRDDYERSIRLRLDSLFSGQETIGSGPSD
jgi:hypothetical protein